MNGDDIKLKLNKSFEQAESFSWIYYVVVVVFLFALKFEVITSSEIIFDSVLTITIVALGAQAVAKIRGQKNTNMPLLKCLKCKKDIEPSGDWHCTKCGWSCSFSDKQKTE